MYPQLVEVVSEAQQRDHMTVLLPYLPALLGLTRLRFPAQHGADHPIRSSRHYPSHLLSCTYYRYPLARYWGHNPIGFLEVHRKPSNQDKYGKMWSCDPCTVAPIQTNYVISPGVAFPITDVMRELKIANVRSCKPILPSRAFNEVTYDIFHDAQTLH